MLVSLILNLNMTGSGPTPSTPARQQTSGGNIMAAYNYDEERKKRVTQDDNEVIFFIETIIRECL